MIHLDTFITCNHIQPADAVVVKKQPFKLLDHYLVYLGKDNYGHVFIANYTQGTRILREHDLAQFLTDFVPSRIVRFIGNYIQRDAAVQRALSRRDQSSYHLIVNNCEHFSTYVQTGKGESSQVQAISSGLVLTGLITASAAKQEETKAIGFLAATIGLMALLTKE